MTRRRTDAAVERSAGVGLVLLFGLGLIAAALMVTVFGPAGRPSSSLPVLAAVTVGCFLAEVLIGHFQVRRESYSFSVGEVPFVIGLAVLSPAGLITARLLGGGLAGAWRRVPAYKIVFNMCLFAFEAAVASMIVSGLTGTGEGAATWVWSVRGGAVLVAGLVNGLAIATVISIFEPNGFRRVVLSAARSQVLYAVNVCLGVLVAIAATQNRWLAGFGLLPILALLAAARLYETLQKKFDHLEALHQFTGTLGRAGDDADVLLPVAMEEVQRILNVESVEVLLSGREGDAPVRLTMGDDGRTVASIVDPESDATIRSFETRSAGIVADCTELAAIVGAEAAAAIDGAVIAPIFGDNGPLGIMVAANRLGAGGAFRRDDVTLLSSLVNHLGAVFHGSLLSRQLRRIAREDGLTGLVNRSGLEAAHPEGARLPVNAALALIDLDRFGDIIEGLGRSVGDELVRELSQRLVEVVGDAGLVARSGDTEFAILFEGVSSDLEAQRWIERLAGVLRPTFSRDGLLIGVAATIGLARADDGDLELQGLLRHAGHAVSDARRDNAASAIYRPHHERDGRRRIVLGAALRDALRDELLVVRYQPKVEIPSGKIVGAEALVRWHHPDYGAVPPPEIVELAERDGLIRELTDYVIKAAVREVGVWRALGHRDLHVAVNLSPRDLLDRDLPDAVSAILVESGLPTEVLQLEVTESGVMVDTDRAIAILEELRRRGIHLSVDDFGTGYSSLSYLRQPPVAQIKIDKSFVMELGAADHDTVIVRSTIELGHNLGLKVVAEGVETTEVLALLGELGCDIAQGYLFSAPLPAEDFRRWLREYCAPIGPSDPSPRSSASGTTTTPRATSAIAKLLASPAA